jgi:hypothetical protein
MADLTTVDGVQISFDSAAVSAVADRDPITGSAVTCVYGVTGGMLKIAEGVDAFLGRLGIANKFAKLNRPDGSPVWINAPGVKTLRAPLPNEYPPSARSVISVGSLTQAVTQDVPTAKAALNALRGPGSGSQPL